MVFSDEAAVGRVLSSGPHTIDGRQVDAKKAIPHQIHQVSLQSCATVDCAFGPVWNVRVMGCVLVMLWCACLLSGIGAEASDKEDLCGRSPD